MTGTFTSLNPEMKEGAFEWFYKNGKLKHKGDYSLGKAEGEHLWYFENGNLEAKEFYKNGLLNGKFVEYYSNGNISNTTHFSKGLQNGMTIYYRENSTKHSEGNFLNGNRDGEWKYFSESEEILGTNLFKTEYKILEASMFLKLPNDEWNLAHQSNGGTTQYIFKRNEITDSNGRKIVPAIMLYIEDATKYNGDATLFSINKRTPFMEKGIKINTTLIQSNAAYPLNYKNGMFMKATYSANEEEHIFYMIHFITDNNKGVQLYMDMTKDIAGEYESEFWTTIKSIKKL